MLPSLAEPRMRPSVGEFLRRCRDARPQRKPLHPPPLMHRLTVSAAADPVLPATVLCLRLFPGGAPAIFVAIVVVAVVQLQGQRRGGGM